MSRVNPGDVFAHFVLPEREGRSIGKEILAQAEAWLRPATFAAHGRPKVMSPTSKSAT